MSFKLLNTTVSVIPKTKGELAPISLWGIPKVILIILGIVLAVSILAIFKLYKQARALQGLKVDPTMGQIAAQAIGILGEISRNNNKVVHTAQPIMLRNQAMNRALFGASNRPSIQTYFDSLIVTTDFPVMILGSTDIWRNVKISTSQPVRIAHDSALLNRGHGFWVEPGNYLDLGVLPPVQQLFAMGVAPEVEAVVTIVTSPYFGGN